MTDTHPVDNDLEPEIPEEHLLVVDDSEDNLLLLGRILENDGYRVEFARESNTVQELVRENPPALILLDVAMPVMDGYEVCRRLKDESKTRDVPVLFLSALSDTDSKVQAFDAGGVDYITKPYAHREVLARVRAHLTIRRLQQQLRKTRDDAQQSSVEMAQLTHELALAAGEYDSARKETQKLNEFSKGLSESTDMEAILQNILTYILFTFNVAGAWFVMVDNEKDEAYTRHRSYAFTSHLDEDTRKFLNNFRHKLEPLSGSFWFTRKRRRALFMRKIKESLVAEMDREIIARLQATGFVQIPVIVQNQVIGILSLMQQYGQPMELSPDDLDRIYRFCEQIGGAIYTSNLLEQVREESEKSDNLLRNILPASVADELKDKGEVAPQSYESVTVLFTDFVGFTQIAETMPPRELIKELDGCFYQFDEISARNKLEKLKTIGDAYMCCGGLPEQNHTHEVDVCLTALEFQAFMNQMREIKASMDLPYWELRIGIHTGPITAGVVGKNKFAYDIWGDTVNTASRMESSGTPGYVNVSATVYERVKYFFLCEHRGKVQAKGKGMVDMYYLRRLRPSLSRDPEGRIPNEKFHELYDRLAAGARFRFRKEAE